MNGEPTWSSNSAGRGQVADAGSDRAGCIALRGGMPELWGREMRELSSGDEDSKAAVRSEQTEG
jgi:hypothetical protein